MSPAGATPASPKGEQTVDPVVPGKIDESFRQVVGGVVHDVLLRLGHQVPVRNGPHPQMYPMLGRGQVRLLATSWLPGGYGRYWPEIRDLALRSRQSTKGLDSSGRYRMMSRPSKTLMQR